MLRPTSIPMLSLAATVALTGCNLASLTTPSDQNGAADSTGDATTSVLSISGRLAAPAGGKALPRSQAAAEGYVVAAQSVETMEIYSTQTNSDGSFELPIPDSEQGNSFTVVLLDPQGRPVGPVVYDESAGEAHTAARLDESLSLGEVSLPGDPAHSPIMPGTDSNAQDMIAADVMARVDENGVPVGVASLGKGSEAMGTPSLSPHQILDRDRDGLPDFLDADNDGDGLVDDFDDDAGDDAGRKEGFRLNFFMNLKIPEENASVYYTGTSADREAALAADTVITFEVVEDPNHSPAITAVEALDRPGPAYMGSMTVMHTGALWADSDYAFDDAGDRFQAFIIPHTLISAGDTFVIQVHLDDGTRRLCYSMINYVFTNIPRLTRYGAPGSLTAYTAGSGIQFDATQDLVLEFQPPKDETGAFITGMDYTFAIFYYVADSQVSVDGATTWPSPPTGFDPARMVYSISATALGALSADDTWTVTLPKEIFPTTVTLTDGTTASIDKYKIDITAEKNGNNAALMIIATRK